MTGKSLHILLLAGCLWVVQGCVSSTLDPAPAPVAAVEPQPAVENASYDPAQRAQAVAEIRAKATQSSGVPTNAYANSDGPNRPMNKSEQEQLINELQADAAGNETVISDSEVDARQRAIREMQRRGQTHYDSAVKRIGN